MKERNEVIKFLKRKPKTAFSASEIERRLNIEGKMLRDTLGRLVYEGVLERRKDRDRTYYYIFVSTKTMELKTEEDLIDFSYDCPDGFRSSVPSDCKSCPNRIEEYHIYQAIGASLYSRGWTIESIAWGGEVGPDVVAWHKKKGVIIIEAKGEGSRSAMRNNYFLMVLGQLLQRMDGPIKTYGIALPAYKQFIGLINGLPDWIKKCLNLNVFLVKKMTRGGYGFEVGYRVYTFTGESSSPKFERSS